MKNNILKGEDYNNFIELHFFLKPKLGPPKFHWNDSHTAPRKTLVPIPPSPQFMRWTKMQNNLIKCTVFSSFQALHRLQQLNSQIPSSLLYSRSPGRNYIVDCSVFKHCIIIAVSRCLMRAWNIELHRFKSCGTFRLGQVRTIWGCIDLNYNKSQNFRSNISKRWFSPALRKTMPPPHTHPLNKMQLVNLFYVVFSSLLCSFASSTIEF